MIKILFILTVISVFLAVSVESLAFILQLKGLKLTQWFGQRAFIIHMVVTGFFWALSFGLMAFLQFGRHPLFHSSEILKWAGAFVCVGGLVMAIWGFLLLGFKRSFGLNFFEDNVSVVEKSLYRILKNPEDYGLWMALAGFALFTRSVYNLALAVEFIVLMIPHIYVENIPLKKSPYPGHDRSS